jgi:Spy/CpxP family protein refolding chaperone
MNCRFFRDFSAGVTANLLCATDGLTGRRTRLLQSPATFLEFIMKIGSTHVCLLALLLVCGTAGSGLAAPGSLGDDVPEARPLRMLASGQFGRLLALRSELDITVEQRTQIRDIVKSHRPELTAALRPVVEKRRALRDATLAEGANEAAIQAAAVELGKAIGDAAKVGSKIKAEVHKVLTPEQREKISQFRGEAQAAVDKFLTEMADPS